ncbi:MAG: FHA domain-containing protein [Bifidobacteriaceae bacterium]|nr:FHA domain-containing protein [Bifidobacteriaceae bacterium]
MSEHTTAQQWIITVNGKNLAAVKAGHSVELGRKPLRPLNNSELPRVEIEDSTRSVSKRHAVFHVAEDGAATIRDLASTNGTFAVFENGVLRRLQPQIDITIPISPFRFQFGDIVLDFVKVEDTFEPDAVSDLFAYASQSVQPEPDAADMSVDDILDLRAGEPTSMFQAQSMSNDSLFTAQENDIEEKESEPIMQIALNPQVEEPVAPLDLFADAHASADNIEQIAQQENTEETNNDLVEESSENATQVDEPVVESVQEAEVVESAQAIETAEPSELGEVVSDNSQIAEQEIVQQSQEEPIVTVEESQTEQDNKEIAESEATQQSETQNVAAQIEESQDIEQPLYKAPQNSGSSPVVELQEQNAQVNIENSEQEVEQNTVTFVPIEDNAVNVAVVDEDARFKPSNDNVEDSAAHQEYQQKFEPGSVFEKVSKGELLQQEQTIEVDGLTSDDAKRTNDFALQFEMARHPELLPFLAMNPNLYDDLFAWLSAQGNADIDAALSRNTGYAEYSKSVGK